MTQVVEVVREYETDCIPPSKRNDKLSYIKDPTTNKTCSLRMTVSQLHFLISATIMRDRFSKRRPQNKKFIFLFSLKFV